MTQVLFKGKTLPTLFQGILPPHLQRQGMQLLARPELRKWGRWSLASFGTALMLSWNWKLVIATGAGLGSMGLVYLALGENWQRYWWRWQGFFKGSQGKLTLAVGSGSLAALSTYIAAELWADTENRWLATGMIAEGVGTILTLALLGWHILHQQNQQRDSQFERLLQQLTAADPLKRLIAVRQLIKRAHQSILKEEEKQELEIYLHLLLSQESEPQIRQTVLNYLQQERHPIPLPNGTILPRSAMPQSHLVTALEKTIQRRESIPQI